MSSQPVSIQPVVLCGGSGTRLWPLSRRAHPKQFIPLVNGKSLLQLTLERLAPLAGAQPILTVAAEEHRFLVAEIAAAAGVRMHELLEPVGRNTAAAIALAALAARPGDLLLVCPSDHHIPDAAAFRASVYRAVPAVEAGAIVLFGVVPTFPSTSYGYIQCGPEHQGGGQAVASFVEKPPLQEAQQMLMAGNVLWNAGIFFCTAASMLAAMERHCPDILACCREAVRLAAADGTFVRPDRTAFQACRAESIDYAVMQKHDCLVVFPFDGAWSDVGSWNAAAQLHPADARGNRVSGPAVVIDSRDTFVHSGGRRVVALGTDNLVIVDTPDAVLVAAASAAEQVRDVVARLEAQQESEAVVHRKVFRPWGWYDLLDAGPGFKVKRLFVKPGAALSLQLHHRRAEHWVVVRGTAEVTRGDETFLLHDNQSAYIPPEQKHRLRNPTDDGLELIEVQTGGYLEEDDIVRFEDQYGR